MTPLPAQQMSDAERLAEDLRGIAETFDRTESFQAAEVIRSSADLIERLRAEREELRADAERYRWLRNESHEADVGTPSVTRDNYSM
jgi:hypothetical protein